MAHELIHWTKAESRLARSFGVSRFGNEAYSVEEIVAELGSCYIAADLDLEIDPRDDHAAYIESWLRALKGNKRCIFQAAAYAQRAADYLHSLQPEAFVAADDDHPDSEEDRQAA
ncbi:zincin-like metallopeptidase domain-containing protein [Mesorhizobium sp. M0046]|uniref:zincin-like metallopeptidase domain-containing protein n=1 Tax=Mesorhizobium sp. M0046 TaxID=2956858 RepID=UPI003337059F